MEDKRVITLGVFYEPAHRIEYVLPRGLLPRGRPLFRKEDDIAFQETIALWVTVIRLKSHVKLVMGLTYEEITHAFRVVYAPVQLVRFPDVVNSDLLVLMSVSALRWTGGRHVRKVPSSFQYIANNGRRVSCLARSNEVPRAARVAWASASEVACLRVIRDLSSNK